MPIYEYHCPTCGLRQSILSRTYSAPEAPRCRRCGGTGLRKLVSSFYAPKSEEDVLDRLADPSRMGDVDENDPRSVAQWARRMARESGEDLGAEFDEMVDRLEAGEMPEGDGEGDTYGEDDDMLA